MINRGDQSIADVSYNNAANVLRSNNTPHNCSQNNADFSNISMMDDMSFNFRTGNRQSFDFTFSSLASSDQLNMTRLKEAFQSYLKKEEVNINHIY